MTNDYKRLFICIIAGVAIAGWYIADVKQQVKMSPAGQLATRIESNASEIAKNDAALAAAMSKTFATASAPATSAIKPVVKVVNSPKPSTTDTVKLVAPQQKNVNIYGEEVGSSVDNLTTKEHGLSPTYSTSNRQAIEAKRYREDAENALELARLDAKIRISQLNACLAAAKIGATQPAYAQCDK
jgi:hypothetical protein